MKKAFRYLPVVTAIISLPAMAHVGYTGRNFGTFDRTYSTARLSDQAITGNYGWIDGTDSDNGDSHKLRPYRFTLAEETNVTLTFEQATSQVTDHLGNVSTSQLGLKPGFSLYQGLAHLAPVNADYDSAEISVANRAPGAEGSFKALADWSIGNDPGDLNGTPIPASLSFFKYVGHAYDGTGFGSDGTLDGRVSHTFMNLKPGDYSVLVGGADYFAQEVSDSDLSTKYGVTATLVAGVVPEPEVYAMVLAGLGLMGAMVRRRSMR
jgi:hypothetical protein